MIIPANPLDMCAQPRIELANRDEVAGNVDHVLRHQGTAQGLVHRLGRVRHRHRAERVAVITVGEAEESVLPGFSHVLPVLQRHFERHLDSDRTRIRKEDPRSPAGTKAVSRLASRSAGSCTMPPNMMCGIVFNCRATHSRICG